jgi:hypothetical protein
VLERNCVIGMITMGKWLWLDSLVLEMLTTIDTRIRMGGL